MEKIIWLVIMLLGGGIFFAIGIFAWRRKQPMWFWSGSDVKQEELSDVPAYNRANGIMWMIYALFLWLGIPIGLWNGTAAAFFIGAVVLVGLPLLIFTYRRIYKKYSVK